MIKSCIAASLTQLVHTSPVVFRAHPQSPLGIIMDLGAILLKHAEENDDLSKKLRIAGTRFMHYTRGNYAKPLNELLLGALEKIEEIRKMLSRYSRGACRYR